MKVTEILAESAMYDKTKFNKAVQSVFDFADDFIEDQETFETGISSYISRLVEDVAKAASKQLTSKHDKGPPKNLK